MPRRSNEFQRLAVVVHRSLEPDWTVTESDMLPDVLTGTLREVDITAKRQVADHDVVLSIECRDHRRPADVSWVESMHSKHQHLPTSKLVLWSRNGFTSEASAKAKLLKIDTVSQADATLPTWARLARALRDGSVQLVTPTLSPFVDVKLLSGTLERFENVSTWRFYDNNDTVVGSVAALVHQILHHPRARTAFLDHAPVGAHDFYVEFVPPAPWYVLVPNAGRCLVHRIGVDVKTVGERSPLSTVSARDRYRVLTLASALTTKGTFEIVLEERSDATVKLLPHVKKTDQ